jgi:hypothetical protein
MSTRRSRSRADLPLRSRRKYSFARRTLPRRITVPDSPPIVLVFAATDPSGGAGLQADILTLSSMGCHPLSVVTAVTIQDTMGVEDSLPIDAEWVADQPRCVLEDMPVIPVYFYVTKRLVKPWVGGYRSNIMDHIYSKDLHILKH